MFTRSGHPLVDYQVLFAMAIGYLSAWYRNDTLYQERERLLNNK